KWGVINTQGKIILPFRYDYQVIHTNYDYLIAVDRAIKEKDNPFYMSDASVYDLRKYAVIDRDGNFIIPFKYTYIKPVNEKYLCVRDDYDANKKAEGKPVSAIYETNGYKLINLKDENVLSEKYWSITYISDDLIICCSDVPEPQGVARYSKIVNIKGETLFDPGKNIQIQPVGYSIKNGRNTEHVFSHKFFILNTYRNVYQSSVKNSLIDIKGNVIIDDYESCEFTEKNMIFRDDKKMTMLDYEGNIIKTEIRDCTLSLINGGYIMIDTVNKNENDRRYGFMDWRGNEIVKRDYEKILRPTGVSSDDTDYIAFIKDGQTLVLNLQNYSTKLYSREAEMINASGKIFYSVEEKTVFEGREVTSSKFIPIE
ncbi:MAG: WG repeat-containing protein, partial [Armatimonadetes bacterium]|nr:WG repeat-containing protein [Candidatus Hippobium faecium]